MILLDLVMPEMDGFEVLDALAARADWRDIPVIVITAKQLTAAERERLLLLHFRQHIGREKPIYRQQYLRSLAVAASYQRPG